MYVPRRHGACTLRYGGVALGTGMDAGDQGSRVVRLDKPDV